MQNRNRRKDIDKSVEQRERERNEKERLKESFRTSVRERERTRKSKDDGRRKKEGVEDFEEREKVISMEGVLTRRKEGRE